MTLPLQNFAMRIAAAAVFGATLVACGGGSSAPATLPTSATAAPTGVPAASAAPATSAADASAELATAAKAIATSLNATPAADAIATSAAPIPAASSNVFGVVTDVRLQNTAKVAQTNVPVTFGQVFAVGDMQPGNTLVGRFESGETVYLQMDVKATHADGSIRHAVVSGIVPSLAVNETRTLSLMKTNAPKTAGVSPKTLLQNGFNASVQATIGGVTYRVSPDDLIKNGSASQTWLSGAVANEWLVNAPLRDDKGVAHPHLNARFAVRWYDAVKKARVDVTVENAWAYEPNPQNFTYDAQVTVQDQVVFSKPALQHFHHSRWRKVFWWGGDASQVHVKHNTAYLIATRALPNYDQSVVPAESALAGYKRAWTGLATEPMSVGLADPYMPSTGGRQDIGLLPGWAASYLLSMDARAKEVTLGTADLAGSWSIHYRDKNTGRPVSLMDYPYMSILGRYGDTYNPVTRQYEWFPDCKAGASCGTPNVHDSAHQPGFAYLPYLVTGDYYYLEELQFWAMYDIFESNPGYRDNIKGLLSWRGQVRAEAWSLRTVAEATYITPDSDTLKGHFTRIMTNNMEWYNARYTNNPAANIFGVLDGVGAVVYGGRGIAPWQDDFFTAAVGHTAELGFNDAKPLLAWKAKAPVLRMSEPMCWVNGAMYAMNIRDSENSPFYTTMAQLAAANPTTNPDLPCNSQAMANALGLRVGEMTGYSSTNIGYPSNMQPALAYSVDARLPNGAAAWAKFMSRSVKPNYSESPQFAIVPR